MPSPVRFEECSGRFFLLVSSFSYTGDIEADPESLIFPAVFLIAPRKLPLEKPSYFCRRMDTNDPLSP